MFKIEQKEIIKNEGGGEEIGDCWMMVLTDILMIVRKVEHE
jgi:hypothetical protein